MEILRKPFALDELAARVAAILSGSTGSKARDSPREAGAG
jgi:DNA-binding response OmpR family regulator